MSMIGFIEAVNFTFTRPETEISLIYAFKDLLYSTSFSVFSILGIVLLLFLVSLVVALVVSLVPLAIIAL